MHQPDALPMDTVPWQELGALLATSRRGNTARHSVEIGIRLLALKKAVPHGEFISRVNAMGGTRTLAWRHMALARRFRGAPDALFEAVGSAAKLLVLLQMEDEECAALVRGEAVAGLTLEQVAQMTAKELLCAVRCTLVQEAPVLQLDMRAVSAKMEAAVAPAGGSTAHQSDWLQISPDQWQLLTAHWTTAAAAPELAQAAGVGLAEAEAEACMLHCYRQCTQDARLALLQVARVLCKQTAP